MSKSMNVPHGNTVLTIYRYSTVCYVLQYNTATLVLCGCDGNSNCPNSIKCVLV